MRKEGSRLFDVLNYAILIALCLSILYPLYYMLIISISDGQAVGRGEVSFFPQGITFATYKVILDNPDFLMSYKNTFIYTIAGTLIAVCMTTLCAYPLSRSKFFGRTALTAIIIFTMFFEGGIIPSYMIVNGLGMVNTVWAILIPPAISVWYMIIMRTFFQQLPNELHESGYVDGANDLQIFLRIILPLSVPVLATMVLFYAVWHWNSFFPAMIYLNEKIKYPVQIIMRNMVIQGELSSTQSAAAEANALGANITGLNIKYAIIFATILPILVVYPFIQKYFVKGMMIGSLKG
ncbi:carbohydrate ABC transporter permease [Cohnella herbarum]|uniref:Carbohydrate ABC transporter permease n=1 Tax=Cohnella herbarum TaxID=2728023 RepID=A0A7Z2VK64_9BACL|nr:carbohydrate ABC transporter permease [Cohnella herbarum]QJD84552.1 carbohydrate ABC transporter permease [Cohnella herbarum]